MAENIIKVTIKQAVKTEAEWESSNPIIPEKVVAFSSDNGKYKIGDGTHHWAELSYPEYGGSDDLAALWKNDSEAVPDPTVLVDADTIAGHPIEYYSTMTDDVTGQVFKLGVSNGSLYVTRIS